MKNTHLVLTLLVVLMFSCTSSRTEELKSYPVALKRIFDAHGGYERWLDLNMLEFSLPNGERQTVNLKSRKILIEGLKRKIGFDGENIWVTPAEEVNGARFYHNLQFYFHSMPFVFGDEGIRYAETTPRNLFGKQLAAVKISFEKEVGDSPDDHYILYYDPETYEMEALMYTVTYFTGQTNESYNLIKYEDWHEVSGLLLPEKIVWYNYEDGQVISPRSEVMFTKVSLSSSFPDESLFEMPEEAAVDSMISH